MEIKEKTIENDLEYLRQVSKSVDFNNNEWKEAVKVLDEYCQNTDEALAMASVQLGIPLRMIYLKKTDLNRLDEDYNESKILINPIVVQRRGLTRYWEACASCLDYMGLVERPYMIEVAYYDENMKKHIEAFEGFSATVLSHELDHLDGILHMDIATEVLNMQPEERKLFREKHPYEIINKDGHYSPKTNIKKKSL